MNSKVAGIKFSPKIDLCYDVNVFYLILGIALAFNNLRFQGCYLRILKSSLKLSPIQIVPAHPNAVIKTK